MNHNTEAYIGQISKKKSVLANGKVPTKGLPYGCFFSFRHFRISVIDCFLLRKLTKDSRAHHYLKQYTPRMSLLKKMFPSVRAQDDDELVDPQVVIRDKCSSSSHCKELKNKLEECNNRVNSRSQTSETCVEELFDYLHALDHCVTKTLFSQLK